MEIVEFNLNSEAIPELSELDVDELIEEAKDKQKEIDRLKELSKQKIKKKTEEIEFLTEQQIAPLQNRIQFIHDHLGAVIKNAEDKTESATQYKKKFISGDLILKKSKKKIVNPKLDPELIHNDKRFKDYIIEETKKKLQWGELKKELKITDDGKVVNKNGEVFDEIEVEEVPEQLIIK